MDDVVLRFANSFLTKQRANVQYYSDPSARGRPRSVWHIAGKPQHLRILGRGSAMNAPVVLHDCGRNVAEQSRYVEIRSMPHGPTFALFLIRHREAFRDHWSMDWKIWGSAPWIIPHNGNP
jgi:hypothetical protein